jgi:hypothetical protein
MVRVWFVASVRLYSCWCAAHGGNVGQLHADDFSALYNTEHTQLHASQHKSVLQRVQCEKAQRRRERQLMEEDAAQGGCW